MKMLITPGWLKKKIEEWPDDIPELYIIGPTMSTETYIKIWLEGKIDHLEGLIKEEVERIKTQYRPDGSLFPNMGTTETIKHHAQIKVLKELQEFLEDIDENLE